MTETALRRPMDDVPVTPPPAPAISYNTPGMLIHSPSLRLAHCNVKPAQNGPILKCDWSDLILSFLSLQNYVCIIAV